MKKRRQWKREGLLTKFYQMDTNVIISAFFWKVSYKGIPIVRVRDFLIKEGFIQLNS